MNIRNQGVTFLAKFLILEYYDHPQGSSTIWNRAADAFKEARDNTYWLATGDDKFLEGSSAELLDRNTLEKTQDAVRITMQMFATVDDIVSRHYRDVKPADMPSKKIYEHVWRLASCFDEELKVIRGHLNDHEKPPTDSYRRQNTAALIAVIFTKYLAYARAHDFTIIYFDYALGITREQLDIGSYLVQYGHRINTESIFKMLKELVEGTDSTDGYSEQAKAIIDKIEKLIIILDTHFQNIIQMGFGGVESSGAADAIDSLNLIFSRMLYKLKAIDMKETKESLFGARYKEAHKKLYRENNGFVYIINSGDNLGITARPIEILRRMEEVMADEYGLYGPITTAEKKKINEGTGSALFMDYMAEIQLVVLNPWIAGQKMNESSGQALP